MLALNGNISTNTAFTSNKRNDADLRITTRAFKACEGTNLYPGMINAQYEVRRAHPDLNAVLDTKQEGGFTFFVLRKGQLFEKGKKEIKIGHPHAGVYTSETIYNNIVEIAEKIAPKHRIKKAVVAIGRALFHFLAD